MKIRLTDSQMPGEELVLELHPEDWYDDDIQVDEEQAQEILDWWTLAPPPQLRNAEIHDEGGHIVIVANHPEAGLSIGWWCQSTSDTHWALDDFPFTSLAYEEITAEPVDDGLSFTLPGSVAITDHGVFHTPLEDAGDA